MSLERVLRILDMQRRGVINEGIEGGGTGGIPDDTVKVLLMKDRMSLIAKLLSMMVSDDDGWWGVM